ncbi:MAG: hypothetical protein E7541_00940 [Ruminococcaceae bacterium]|nr:hypothetical protein [Oscillospiraceae bacterium]
MDALEVERRLSHVEDRSKSNTHRLDELERRQEDMAELVRSVATIAQKQTDMDRDVREIKADVKLLAAKPGRRWEAITDKALLAAVTGLVGYVLIRLGL